MWWQLVRHSPQLCKSLSRARLCELKGTSQTGAQRRGQRVRSGGIWHCPGHQCPILRAWLALLGTERALSWRCIWPVQKEAAKLSMFTPQLTLHILRCRTTGIWAPSDLPIISDFRGGLFNGCKPLYPIYMPFCSVTLPWRWSLYLYPLETRLAIG